MFNTRSVYLFKSKCQKCHSSCPSFIREISSAVLSFNCGSSSIKCKAIDPKSGTEDFDCHVDKFNTDEATVKMSSSNGERKEMLLERPNVTKLCRLIRASILAGTSVLAVGHRIVHGGGYFDASVLIDDDVRDKIERASIFAPLHNAASLKGISAMSEAFPDVPQVAVFDTAFHSSMPDRARRYALPEAFYQMGILRHGFHGSSHKYAFQEAARLLPHLDSSDLKVATAHLGNGCSIAAVRGGQSVDTTMGLTPLEGLMMGTRAGDVDPTIFTLMKETQGWDIEETLGVLNRESGFLGVAGTSDSREVEKAVMRGCPRASLAMEMFCYRVAKSAASFLVSMGGLDAIVFTGGIGEKSAMKRRRILEMLRPLGFEIDRDRNEVNGKGADGFITRDASPKAAIVVKANEELMIARETFQVISSERS